ncbi:acetyltransferase (plasmid) [Salipiger sp. H15]|uniref:Acetyltransferase n=1 Tax=Alloyangia sp. H15 TaxID=3029062 RepID=A0AAU8AQJ7_9RHOB
MTEFKESRQLAKRTRHTVAKQEVIPLGCSGNLLEILHSLDKVCHVSAIIDDAPHLQGREFQGIPVYPFARTQDFPGAKFLCLIGSARSFAARSDIIARTGLPAERFATFLHPTAFVSEMAEVGCGSVAYDGVLVTSNARIGEHVLMMPRCVIHHDVTIGNFTLIGTNVILAGGVRVGESCYIGSGSALRDGVEIGDGALVGMGSVVVRDVEPGSIVAGNPARPLPRRT